MHLCFQVRYGGRPLKNARYDAITPLYHTMANPSERILRDIYIYLRAYCHNNHKKWFTYCPIIEAIINLTPNPTTKVSPEKLMTGIEPESMFHGLVSLDRRK